MNAKEIVQGLRYEQKKRENDFVGTCETDISTMCKDAAGCIESLQAQLERFNATLAREGFTELETMIAKYKTVILAANELSIETDEEIEALREQLKESQRREQAAVEDWMHAVGNANSMLACEACAHRRYNDEDGIYCALKACNPQWRGPVAGDKLLFLRS